MPCFHRSVPPSVSADTTADQGCQLLQSGALALRFYDPLRPGGLQHPARVLQGLHDHESVLLVRFDELVLESLVYREVLRGHEARPDVHPGRSQGQGGDRGAAVADSTAGNQGRADRVHRRGYQDDEAHFFHAGMPAALGPDDGDHVDTHLLRLDGVPDAGTLVNVDEPAVGDLFPLGLRAAPGRLQDLHPGLDDPVDTYLGGGVPRVHLREQAHVDPEGLVGLVAYLLDLFEEFFLGFVEGGRQAAKASSIGDRSHDLRRGQRMHGPALNRVPYSQHLRHLRLEHFLLR